MAQALDRRSPGLYGESADGQPLVFPLQHTDVQAKITGNLSRVAVTQTFKNPFTTPLEAVYVFPLPDEAAVDAMTIRLGDRTIVGTIKKRQEAQEIYAQAKRDGRTAGLLEQERDNIFTQSLANVLPGERIEVTICYTDSLKFAGGDYEFVFPMVVGPRYIPGTVLAGGAIDGSTLAQQDTDRVPDASRLNPPILPPGTRCGHDISVTVEIAAGVPIHQVISPSHQLQIGQLGTTVRVQLNPADTIPNKDLILRYQVAGEQTQTTVLAQADERGGHFAAYLIPAIQYHPEALVAKDVVFLIDTSGSQAGDPLFKCQELMRRFINGLNPNDTFSIIDFSNTTRQLSPVPLANTPEHRSQAIAYINQLTANGGTEMQRGIQAVLNFPIVEPGRLRSIVLLTDGYIGNENEILAEVQRHLQLGNRLYSFGVGSSVNRFLLNRIAELGRGISQIIRHDEPTAVVAEKFFRQINNPVLTHIQLRWEGAGEAPIVYPLHPADLFAEQPLVLFGRKGDRQPGQLQVTGVSAGGHRYQQTFTLDFGEPGNPAIAQLWGRARIKDLTNQMVSGDTKAGVEAVTDTALTYQLLSQYTAFVAVSDDVRTASETTGITVAVPVEMPEAVSHLGVFGSAAPAAAPEGIRMRRRKTFERSPAMGAPAPLAMGGFPQAEAAIEFRESSATNSESPNLSDQFDAFDFGDADGLMGGTVPGLDAISLGQSPARSGAVDRRSSEGFSGAPPAQPGAASKGRLQVVSATGLEAAAIAHLTQHLQAVQIPSEVSGTEVSGIVVLEFQVTAKRVLGVPTGKYCVVQLVLDQQASTLQESSVLDVLRRSLITWQPQGTIVGTVRLVLQIN
jgi:Ca-activated chloride channel homolog